MNFYARQESKELDQQMILNQRAATLAGILTGSEGLFQQGHNDWTSRLFQQGHNDWTSRLFQHGLDNWTSDGVTISLTYLSNMSQ